MRTLIKTVYKIFLIFVFINAISYAINFISTVDVNKNIYVDVQGKINVLPDIIGMSIAFIIVSLLLLLLWWKADKVIKFIAGDISDNEITINTSNEDLHRVIMRILGIIIVVSNVPYLIVTAGYYFFYSHLPDQIRVDFSTNEIRQMAIHGVTILLGIWLAVGNKAIQQFFKTFIKDEEPVIENSETQSPESEEKKE